MVTIFPTKLRFVKNLYFRNNAVVKVLLRLGFTNLCLVLNHKKAWNNGLIAEICKKCGLTYKEADQNLPERFTTRSGVIVSLFAAMSLFKHNLIPDDRKPFIAYKMDGDLIKKIVVYLDGGLYYFNVLNESSIDEILLSAVETRNKLLGFEEGKKNESGRVQEEIPDSK